MSLFVLNQFFLMFQFVFDIYGCGDGHIASLFVDPWVIYPSDGGGGHGGTIRKLTQTYLDSSP